MLGCHQFLDVADADGEKLPTYPRRARQEIVRYQSVFEALMVLILPRQGGMQAVVVRSGKECQLYILALQRGIEERRHIHAL